MLSAPIAALAGALCVPYTQIVTPDVFSVANTVDALLMVLIGGTGLLVGPIIGAVIFTHPALLSRSRSQRPHSGVFRRRLSSIMIFAPGGLHQISKRLIAPHQRGRP